MADDYLPYQKGPDGRLQYVADAMELPQGIALARLALEAGRVEGARAILNDGAMDQTLPLLKSQPPRPGPMFLLGMMFAQVGQAQEAKECFERILTQRPHPLVFYELGRLYRETGFPSLATECRRKAVALDPKTAEFRLGLALDLIREGRIDEGLALLREVVAEDPLNADARSKLLFYLHYLPSVSRAELSEEHRQWGRVHAPLGLMRRHHDRDMDPDRRIRIGYVSADFRRHSVSYTFEPLLENHDRDRVEVYAYAHVACPDEVTERLRSKFDHYREILSLDDRAVAERIEQDRIDILVAIAGHSGGHRLTVFGLKPAPIQVDLGSISTTGLPQIDYRLTDQRLDPPETQPYYVEQLVYIPDGYVCYRPPEFAPSVDPLPARLTGGVTFGSFNNSLKINPYVVALWSEVLRRTVGSRLLLKCNGGGDAEWVDRLRKAFEQSHIDPQRIEVCARKSPVEHLQLYGQVDVGLDPYPFNGCMSTLEALWMGVPVVSLAGRVWVSRMGLTILSRLGMDALVTSDPDVYIAAATALANNLDALDRIRRHLRPRMMASPLCDGRRYARQIETAYRRMWRRWCEDQKPEARPIPIKPSALSEVEGEAEGSQKSEGRNPTAALIGGEQG